MVLRLIYDGAEDDDDDEGASRPGSLEPPPDDWRDPPGRDGKGPGGSGAGAALKALKGQCGGRNRV